MASRGRSSNSGHGHSGGGVGGHSGGFNSHGGGPSPRPHHYRSGSMSDIIMSAFIAKQLFGEGEHSDEPKQAPSVPQYNKIKDRTKTKIVSIVLFSIVVIFALLAIFSVEISYGKVVGTVENWYLRPEFGETYYYTNYHYIVDGKEYSSESSSGWTQLPESAETYMGSEQKLYYLRSDPYTIYEVEDKANIPTYEGVFVFFVFVFLIMGIFVAVNGIYKVQENPEWKKQQTEIKEKQELGGKSKCAYCGTIVEEGKTRCPSCGASIK